MIKSKKLKKLRHPGETEAQAADAVAGGAAVAIHHAAALRDVEPAAAPKHAVVAW